MWQVCQILAGKDVMVTNQKDKDKQLGKLRTLVPDVKAAGDVYKMKRKGGAA